MQGPAGAWSLLHYYLTQVGCGKELVYELHQGKNGRGLAQGPGWKRAASEQVRLLSVLAESLLSVVCS